MGKFSGGNCAHAMISTKLFPGCEEGSDAAEGEHRRNGGLKWRKIRRQLSGSHNDLEQIYFNRGDK